MAGRPKVRQIGALVMDTQAVVLTTSQSCAKEVSEFELDVIAGLSSETKSLPAKYFYDATGSALFERITGLQEYYVTRSEVDILNSWGPAIGSLFPPNCALVEFGAGSSRKSRILLRVAASIGAYVPVDISGEFLRQDITKLQTRFPCLAVYPIVCDFTKPFHLPEGILSLPRVGFFPGSTIGNLEPRDAAGLLRHIGWILGKEAMLIVGVDLVKDKHTLTSAYNDVEGVTARFNLNLLKRINRELDGNFNVQKFRHFAFFNAQESRIEMRLVSQCRQEVRAAGRVFHFDADESIHTENSYKYTVKSFQSLAAKSGWSAVGVWTDGLYSVHALRAGSDA
jgi:L-histidine Nalpha-methyltransferase